MTLLPDDFFDEVPRRNHSELAEAARLARANFGRWVQVGEPRFVAKDVSAWCSEVNLGQKAELGGTSESWEARGRPTGVESDEGREFVKAIRYLGPASGGPRTELKTVDLHVRLQTQDDTDVERLQRAVSRELGHADLDGLGDVTYVFGVYPLDADTATGRQALDRQLHLHPNEG